MSQVELSRKLGLTQSYLSTIENGKYQLSAEKENLLKQVMGLDNLDDYYIASVVERDKRDEDIVNEGDLLGQLLKNFMSMPIRKSRFQSSPRSSPAY